MKMKGRKQLGRSRTPGRWCSATNLVIAALIIFLGGIMVHNRSLGKQLSPQVISIPVRDLRAGFKSAILPSEPEPTLPPDAHLALHVSEVPEVILAPKSLVDPQPKEEHITDKKDEHTTAITATPKAEHTINSKDEHTIPVATTPKDEPISTPILNDDWKIDPYGNEHARVHAGASGSLLAAMRRHHLVHDFVVRDKSFYTNQTCEALLEYFADVLPRSRNLIKTMEYSLGNLKEQVKDLLDRNSDLDKFKDDAAKYLPADITQSLWPHVSRNLLSQWSFEISYRRSLLKYGRQTKADGVKYNEKKGAWTATVMIGKSRYGLGDFKTETAAQGAIDKELKAAKRLGYGATDTMPGSCESKLKQTYLKIHEVMLDSRDLDTSTASLRQRIAAAHDRNRVLERYSELSHSALHWLASPLLNKEVELPVVRSSRITNPVVIKVIDEWKDSLGRKTSVAKKELVFPPVPAPCTPEYIADHTAKKTYKSFKHACKTPEILRKEKELHGNLHDPRHPNYIHFVHIPKAGGTSFTKVLRRMVCTKNKATEAEMDCCAVGWCDWQKGITCQNIHGCTNHIPRIGKWLNKPLPSVTMMRDPSTRFISAWHYRCHNPNYDCFGIRKQFKAIRSGKARRFSFDEYCQMPEYQNIMVKMLVKDKFPYGDYGELTLADMEMGKANLNKFVFVGMNEMYDTSMVLLAEALDLPMTPADFDKERSANRPKAYKDFMEMLQTNSTLQAEIYTANQFDIGLYHHARRMFCDKLRKSSALIHPMLDIELDKKNICIDLWNENPPSAT